MKWIHALRHWRRVDAELKEEMAQHLEEKVEALIEAGMTAPEARTRAHREFGNATHFVEESRDQWGFAWLDDISQDLRYGFRTLRRSPVLTGVAALSLALGIGANTAIFSLIDAILLRTLPVRQPESLVIVRALTRQGTRDHFAHADYEWLRDHNEVFSGLVASSLWKFNLDVGDHKEKVTGELVSGNYFSVLGVQPFLGRMIAPDDDTAPGNHPIAVVSYAYWQRALGSNPQALSQYMRFGNTTLEIVGVVSREFSGESAGELPDFWVPLSMEPQLSGGNSYLHMRNVSWLDAIGRLKPGVTIRQARSSMDVLLESMRLALHYNPQSDYLASIGIEPGGGGFSSLRDRYAQPLVIVMAMVALVMVIACANVANLLLARATARRREFAIRLAIGASRSRLIRQLLTEACLLAAIACAVGLAVTQLMAHGLLALSHVDSLDVHLNVKVLAFAAAVSCGAAVTFGLAPSLQSRRMDSWSTLKLDVRSVGRGTGRFNLSRLLVTAQTTISLVLLIAAGLLLRTFLNLKELNPGFDEQHVVQANIDPSLSSVSAVTLGQQLVERLAAIDGVQSVSFSGFGFGAGSNRICCVDVEGYTPHPNEDKNVRVQWVSPRYFETLGITLVAGRDFTEADQRKAPEVVIINETMARYYFQDASPIGKHFAWWPTDPKNIEIVSVVKDAKYDNLRQQPLRMAYQSIFQHGSSPNFLQVRVSPQARRSLSAVMQDCRAVIHAVDPHVPIRTLNPLSTAVDRTLQPERLVAQLSVGFGIVALLLTSIGLYGILAYMVARRTSEFGIRMALGAGRSTILRMVMRDGLALVLIGLGVGLFAAYACSSLMASLLYGVQARDVTTFSMAAFALLAVGLLASYGPARRATNVEPIVALRYE
jgi:predicted permease